MPKPPPIRPGMSWDPMTETWGTATPDPASSGRWVPCLGTWPTSGMTRRGSLLPPPMLGHLTAAGESSSSPGMLPTPQGRDGDPRGGGPETAQGRLESGRRNLTDAVGQLLPTPYAKLGEARPDYARQDRDGSGGDDLTTAVFRAENTANLPTPTTRDAKGRNQRDDASCLPGAVERMTPSEPDLLPTPRASEGPKGSPNQHGSSGDLMLTSAILQLPEEATTPLLPTPDAAVFNDGQTPEAWAARHARELTKGYNGNGGGTPLAGVVQFLPTPEASDATGGRTATELGGTRTSGTKRAITLGAAVSPRLLPTPVVTDAASSGSRASGEDAKAHPGTSLTDALVRDAAPPAPTRPTSTTPADSAQATAEGHAPPSGGDRLMATPRVASERTSRHAATSRENRSAPSLAQSAEIAAGILPREFTSWDDLPASWRPAETTTTAGSAPTPPPSDDGRLF
jgi:hypothetical protein